MKKISFILMIISMIVFSCEPEVIEGPEGPQGEQGPPGVDGEDGEDGNANVISITKSVASSDWIPEGTAGDDLYYYYEISVPEISSKITDDGVVLVFGKQNNSYAALPAVFYFYSSYYEMYYSTTIRYGFTEGSVRIEIEDSDLFTFRPESTLTFKIVIIEGFVSSAINLNDYNSIKQLF